MKFKALTFVAVVVLSVCAYLSAARHVSEIAVPTQAVVKQYYSSSQRTLDAIGEGVSNKEK